MQLFSRMVELFTLNSGRVVDAFFGSLAQKDFFGILAFSERENDCLRRVGEVDCGWLGGCTIGNLNQKEAPPIFACKPRCPSDEDEEDVDAEKIVSRNIRRTNI